MIPGALPPSRPLSANPDRSYAGLLVDTDRDNDLDIVVSNDAPDTNRVYLNAEIVTRMPQIEPRYHVHPHSQLCAGGRWIVYTSTVHGCSDVAVVPMAALLAATTKAVGT